VHERRPFHKHLNQFFCGIFWNIGDRFRQLAPQMQSVCQELPSSRQGQSADLASKHLAACAWLLVATILWGISFPLIKTLVLRQQLLVPEAGSAFLAAWGAVLRFGTAAAVAALVYFRTLPTITRLEFRQGVTLAFFGGMGILLQMDGLAHTAASTSAFLTQFYCLILPIWTAVRYGVRPNAAVIVSFFLVFIGASVLSGVDVTHVTIGRGELETILAAMFFAGQILCLDNPKYARNRTGNFTVVMFALTAALNLPFALLFAPTPDAFWKCCADGPIILMLIALVLFCTLGAYILMNVWQRFITPTQAGIIYCFEPVAASAFALFLPLWLSTFASVAYANERLTGRLLLGGLLIFLANILIQLKGSAKRV
jgi:drug/metabolite transporter (DMT)-like permease